MNEQELEEFINLCFNSKDVSRFNVLLEKFTKYVEFDTRLNQGINSITTGCIKYDDLKEYHYLCLHNSCDFPDMDQGQHYTTARHSRFRITDLNRTLSLHKEKVKRELQIVIEQKKFELTRAQEETKARLRAVDTAHKNAVSAHEHALKRQQKLEQELEELNKTNKKET